MITDTSGKLTYVNPAWSQIYGFTLEEAIGNTPRLLHSGYQDEAFYRTMWDAICDPSKNSWKGEIVNRSKDGTLIPVLLTITAIRSSDGEVTGHMGIALDMSAQKQLEAKVLQQDRLASIGILASGLAHEVGTPLGVVRGRAEFLMMQAEAENPMLKSGLQVIVSQIDRISKLIHSLLRFSRSTDDVRMREVPLLDVIHEVENLIGQSVCDNHIELKIEVAAGQQVFADFNRLQQVVLNLVVNAVHAMQTAIRDGNEGPHVLTIQSMAGAHDHKNQVRILVKDTGCGIAPENMRKLFQPFFTTKDVGEGTGLGLAIVSKLVHEMGGETRVDSVLGECTQFTLYLAKV